MIDKELEAQIQLLEDSDTQIFSIIREQLVSKGEQVIPVLENAWGNSSYPLVNQRIENIIHEINFNQILKDLEHWVQEGKQDWFTILYLLSKFYYQNIDKIQLHQEIQKIRNDIWLEINDNLTALEKIQVFNRIFYKKYQFSQNTSHRNSKNSFFLSELIDTKKGNDLSLGLLYLLLSESLEFPIYGIDLPNNFILAYLNTEHTEDFNSNSVLFYINPINEGIVFGVKEIDIYIEKNKLDSTESYYTPTSNSTILLRYINELSKILEQESDSNKVAELEKIRQIVI